MGSARRTRCACEMDRGRLSACLLDPAFCDGLDGGDLGRRGRSAAPEGLAGAAAGCDPFLDMGGKFRFESHPLGQRRLCDSPRSNGAHSGRRENGGKARGKRPAIVELGLRAASAARLTVAEKPIKLDR